MSALRIATFVVGALVGAACTTTTTEPFVQPAAVEFETDFPSSGEVWLVTSPDGELRIELALVDGAPVYRVVRDTGDAEQVVVGVSALGLETSLGSLGTQLQVAEVSEAVEWSDSFALPTGKQRSASIVGRQRTISFEGADTSVGLDIELIATDHGVAHRSRITPGADEADGEESAVRLDWERTSFAMPPESMAWLQQHDLNSFGRPAYEQVRDTGRAISQLARSPEGWTFPALFEHEGHWSLITEAGVDAGHAASHLGGLAENGEFSVVLPSAFDGNGVGAVEPSGQLPFATPWRLIITSPDIGDIVESNLVRHLSPPGRDLPWVQPGVAAWSWWSDQDSPRNPEALAEFIDFAADFGWEYALIDANWNAIDPIVFESLLADAVRQGVGPLLWYNSGGPNNSVAEAPRGLMSDRAVRRAEMERIAALGVAGIKVDFFHSDKPAGIQLYLDILEDAADFELLVVFHGSTVPRGWSRTWPNLMTMEAVLGGEQSIFNTAFSNQAPRQSTVLPFTRNVVGSMDYTPVNLGDRYFRQTSNGHELALSVLFESGLQHFVDTPATYLAQPDAVQSALQDVPTAWDDTVFLSGGPDDHVVLARRVAESWWVAAINGPGDELTVQFDPARLDAVGRTAQRICDGADRRSYSVDTVELTGSIDLAMLSSGGCLLRID